MGLTEIKSDNCACFLAVQTDPPLRIPDSELSDYCVLERALTENKTQTSTYSPQSSGHKIEPTSFLNEHFL